METMTTKETAEALGVDERTIRRHAAALGLTENGKQTYLDEKSITIIKARIERSGRNDLDNVVQLPNTTTDLEMMMRWRDELEEIKDQAGIYAIEKYERMFNCSLSAYGEETLKKEVSQFCLTNVLEAMDITSLRLNIPPNDRMRYMAGICWNKIKESK